MIRVKEKEKAKYAFVITLDFLNKKPIYNNEVSKQLCLEENILNMTDINIHLYYNTKKTFIFEAYEIHKNDVNNKVFEGYTFQINNDKNIKELDKGILGFVLCSVNALFNKKIKCLSEYQEYYYQCL